MKNNASLGKYMLDIFDLDGDGRVTFKEFFSVLVPSYAVAIALLVVDLLALAAEYRVWDVGMTITGGDVLKAIGFVLVSLVPFYLAQILWLYPRATGWQQFIALMILLASLLTSAQFGLADLSKSYDVDTIVSWVIWLTFGYIIALLVYVLIDKNIRLYRMKARARAKAAYQMDVNAVGREVLADMRLSLEEEMKLRKEFGDESVEAHLSIFRDKKNKKESRRRSQPEQTKQYPVWTLEDLLDRLELPRTSALIIARDCRDENDFYQAMIPYGIEAVDVSRKDFGELFGELKRAGNPSSPPRPNQ